ncbi:ABC transporter substrate-binding protein [Halalkalibacter okhensis]|uniref:Sugar ABC transporter substrate-binding protein n=1 Tax=Halalkalibacter okhensis TaxID=333138 RepID=A0A0B0IPN5_9BACI|nr:sugar ABC transporter substrate-binding protein [Halalkalibacter okhensis]KHF41641.1 hypothetical protein LQ50_02780 [Halalkalibacter okhensis]
MKSKRHLLGFTLLFLLFLMTVVGCAATENVASPDRSGDDGGAITIEFAYWAGAGGEADAFDTLIAKFEEENPDIKIHANQQPSGDDFHTRLQTRIAGNESPDVFRLQYQRIGNYTSQNALLDVTDLIEGSKSSYNSSLLTAVTVDDKYYGVPHHTDTLAVFYNKTYMDQLGITPPNTIEDAWTWEELLEASVLAQSEGLASHGIAFNWTAGSVYRSLPFFFHNNASLLSDDLTSANVTTPEAIESLAFLQEMFQEHMSDGNSIKGSDDYNLLFTTGHTAFLINGNWMIPRYEVEMEEYEWGVTYMPVKKSAASDLGGNSLVIPHNAKHPEEAKRFLEFMIQPENMKTFVEMGLFIPARTDIDGSFNYTMENPELMDLFIEQSLTVPQELAETVTMSEFASINQVLADELEALFMLGKTPEEVAESLNDEINRIVN